MFLIPIIFTEFIQWFPIKGATLGSQVLETCSVCVCVCVNIHTHIHNMDIPIIIISIYIQGCKIFENPGTNQKFWMPER